MIYYETLVLLFFGVAIVPFVVGFLFKSKSIRYFCWSMGVLLLFLPISTIITHRSDVEKTTSQFLGIFKVDKEQSIYLGEKLKSSQDITLAVTSDETFMLIGDTSPFIADSGTWEFHDNEDGGYVELYMNKKPVRAYRSLDNNVWRFESDCLTNGISGDIIYFIRTAQPQ